MLPGLIANSFSAASLLGRALHLIDGALGSSSDSCAAVQKSRSGRLKTTAALTTEIEPIPTRGQANAVFRDYRTEERSLVVPEMGIGGLRGAPKGANVKHVQDHR